MVAKWKAKTTNGDLAHYYAYPTTGADGTPCVGFSILILTKEPQNYIGGEVERMFFGKALYVVREIHTLATYKTLTSVINDLVRMKAWDKKGEPQWRPLIW